jgi:hypothetical protein
MSNDGPELMYNQLRKFINVVVSSLDSNLLEQISNLKHYRMN